MQILYLGPDMVKLIETKKKGKRILVTSLFASVMPNEYLNSPDTKAFEEVANTISEGIREINSRDKKISIVLDNGNIPFTRLTVPKISKKKLYPIIKLQLFSDEKLTFSNTIDFISANDDIQKGQKEIDVFATYISNNIISDLRNFISELGLKLISIDIAQNANIKLLKKNSYSMSDTYIYADIKESAITFYLMENNQHIYSFTKALIPFTAAQISSNQSLLITEISNAIKETMSFFNQKFEEIIPELIYYSGSIDRITNIIDSIASKVDLPMEKLEIPDFIENVEQDEFNEFTTVIAATIRESK